MLGGDQLMNCTSEKTSWLRRFSIICASVLLLIFVVLVLLVSFLDLGLSRHGILALFIGVMLTVALTMVLMGLVFLSNRGGYDETAQRTASNDSPPEESPSPNGRPRSD